MKAEAKEDREDKSKVRAQSTQWIGRKVVSRGIDPQTNFSQLPLKHSTTPIESHRKSLILQ